MRSLVSFYRTGERPLHFQLNWSSNASNRLQINGRYQW